MRWIHISDLHFGDESYESVTMLDNLHKLAERVKPVQCLFVTGDLRDAERCPDSYPTKEVNETLARLQETLGITPKDTFIVQGNHDVNDPKENDEYPLHHAVDAILGTYYKPGSSKVIDQKSRHWDTIQWCRQDFLAIQNNEKICQNWPKPGEIHFVVSYHGFNIMCLNTALFCYRRQVDGNLILGKVDIDCLFKKLDKSQPLIVLAHHDFGSINPDERNYFYRKLSAFQQEQKGVVLYLCGHEHVSGVKSEAQGNSNILTVLGGTSKSQTSGLRRTDMIALVGEMNAPYQEGYVQAYRWEDGVEDWLPDQTFSYDQFHALDGCRYFPTRPPSARPHKVTERDYLEYVREQCAEMALPGFGSESAARAWNLEKFFVQPRFWPLSFEDYGNQRNKISVWLDSTLEDKVTSVTLSEIMKETPVRFLLLSENGGGKTAVIKRLACLYAGRTAGVSTDDNRELPFFPVWIDFGKVRKKRDSLQNMIRDSLPPGMDRQEIWRRIQEHFQNADALLLLDNFEACDSAEQQAVLEELSHFLTEQDGHQTTDKHISVILSLRSATFDALREDRTLSALRKQTFRLFEIAPLNQEQMQLFCDNWTRFIGISQANGISADAFWNESSRKRMARNPMRLLVLLRSMSKYRRGLVRTSDFYRSMLNLVRGNAEAIASEAVDLTPDEWCQILSFVAFRVYADRRERSTISESELREILCEMRQQRGDLISTEWSEEAFLNACFWYLEREKCLQATVVYSEEREVKTYRFLYDELENYLAARAIVKGCVPEYVFDPADLLVKYLNEYNFAMNEVIVLAAEMNVYCGHQVIHQIVQLLHGAGTGRKKVRRVLRGLLLRLLTEEVPLFDGEAEDVFRCMYQNPLLFDDIEGLIPLSKGRYGKLMKNRLEELGRDFYHDSTYWTPLLDILHNPDLNPVQYYLDRCLGANAEREKGLSMLACFLWIASAQYGKIDGQILRKLDVYRNDLQSSLFHNAETNDLGVQWHALRVISLLLSASYDDGKQGGKQETFFREDAFVRYLSACVLYMNHVANAERKGTIIPPAKKVPYIEFYTVAEKMQTLFANPALSAFPPSPEKLRFEEQTAANLYRFFDNIKRVEETSRNYRDLCLVILLASIFHGAPDDVRNLHGLIEKWRQLNLAVNPTYRGIDKLYGVFAETLRKTVLLNPAYSQEEQQTMRDCIGEMDRCLMEQKQRVYVLSSVSP